MSRVKELKSNALPLALPSEEESQAAAGRQDPQDDGRPPPMENDLHYLHRSLQHVSVCLSVHVHNVYCPLRYGINIQNNENADSIIQLYWQEQISTFIVL